jgi:hypothetical protein
MKPSEVGAFFDAGQQLPLWLGDCRHGLTACSVSALRLRDLLVKTCTLQRYGGAFWDRGSTSNHCARSSSCSGTCSASSSTCTGSRC